MPQQNSCAPESVGVSLQVFQRCLSLLSKGRKSVQGRHPLKRLGFAEGYAEGELVIVLDLNIPGVLDQCHLIFHRVPDGISNGEVLDAAALDARHDSTVNESGKGETDGMLSVRYAGQFADHVVAAGVTVPSWVWLLPPQRIPEFGGDPAFFVLETAFQVSGAGSPREMNVLNPASGYDSNRGEQGLVEGVSGLQQSLRRPSSSDIWQRIAELDLVEIMSCSRVELGEIHCMNIVEKLPENGAEFCNAFPCPADRLARLFELRKH